ncbi:MAG: M1 family aminopeptidase [Acidobacteriota bacterium]|nr:M1 family aminopeptidase [Acidobacteriota bacterium]
MFQKLFAFEWRFHTRQISFYAAVLIFFGLGLMVGSQDRGSANIFLNAPYNIGYTLGTMSLGCIFVVTLFTVAAMMRDHEHAMDQIIHATPVGKLPFLAARFTGSLAAAFIAYAVIAPGMFLSGFLPFVDADRLGPVDMGAYAWNLLVLVLPNVFFCATLLFAVAALTRRALAAYVAGIALYFLYFAASALMNSPIMAASVPASPEGQAVAAVLDPFGLNAFFEQTRYWTAHERNTMWVALEGNFLLNRLLWTGVSALLLGLVYRAYTFRIRSRASKQKAVTVEAAPVFTIPKTISRAGGGGRLRAFRAMLSLQMKGLTGSLLFWGAQLMWTVVLFIELWSKVQNGNAGSPTLPTTGILLQDMQEVFGLFGYLVLIYFGSELIWRERGAGIEELMDTAPVGNRVFYATKLTALVSLVAVTLGMGFVSVVLVQVVAGWSDFRWDLYPAFAWFHGMPLVLTAVLVLLVQSLFRNKYTALLASVAAVLVLHRGWFTGLEHNLLLYAGIPSVFYSEMNGFGAYATPFNWFTAYWSVFALLLALITLGLWRRGTEAALKRRFAGLGRRLGMPGKLAAAGCGAVFLLLGGFIYSNTNIFNTYRTRDQNLDRRAEYEKRYKSFAGKPSPVVVDASLKVDLFPVQRRAVVSADYLLENRSGRPIEEVLLRLRHTVQVQGLHLEGSELLRVDAEHGTYHYRLDRPLQPGSRLQAQVDLAVTNPGFTNGGPDNAVAANGSFLMFTRVVPALGYREALELRDNRERRKRGLPPRERKTLYDWDAEHEKTQQGRLGFQVILSTSEDQIALAPGNLERQWQENGRRYYHYKAPEPISAHIGMMSADYRITTVDHHGIAVQVYHHPSHHMNVDAMIEAARRSLDLFSERFGPYPFPHLRIFEIPGHWQFFSGVGFANTVGLLETRGFLADRRKSPTMDQLTRRIAHETAHQWWGHWIDAADAPGAAMLIEALTKYSEMLVLEDIYGKAAMRPYLIHAMDRYLRGRTGELQEEMPLYQADASYLVYHKGVVVMYALRELLGEDLINRCLRRLLAKKDVLTTDFLAELYREAPAETHHLIDLWLKRVAVYDLSVTSAGYRELPEGRYQVDIEVKARLNEITGKGEERALTVNQAVPIGIFSANPNRYHARTLYLENHIIAGETARFSITVDEKPGSVGIDPFVRMIDRNRFDNLKTPVRLP